MIRGSQTLTAIFPASIKPEASRKGNKGIYTIERDIALAYRFYFYYHIKRKRFDDSIADMEKEFFISSATIVSRLTLNDDLLKDIQRNNPNSKQLNKRYPHLNWN